MYCCGGKGDFALSAQKIVTSTKREKLGFTNHRATMLTYSSVGKSGRSGMEVSESDNWLRVFPAELICLKAFRYLTFHRSSQKDLSLISLTVYRHFDGSRSIQARDSDSFDLRTV